MTRDDLAADTPNKRVTPETRLVGGRVSIEDLDAFLAELEAIAAETGAVVQAVDADRIVDGDHLRLATRLAARAVARGEAVARDPAVEVLLYAAGRRQIDQALALGVEAGEKRVGFVVADFGDVPGAAQPSASLETAVEAVEQLCEPAQVLGTFDEAAVRSYYEITDRELKAVAGDLSALVRERVALLDVEK
jgi:KEOPS complex subunit Cgi121